jgi:hypothetical protein
MSRPQRVGRSPPLTPDRTEHLLLAAAPSRGQPTGPARMTTRELQAGCGISCLAGHGLKFGPAYDRTWVAGTGRPACPVCGEQRASWSGGRTVCSCLMPRVGRSP